jgi:hypothetical protein
MPSEQSEIQERIERGQEAKRFIDYITVNPYFQNVLKQIDEDLLNEIMGLDPKDTIRWSHLQAARMCLYSPIHRIRADYDVGQRAQAEGTVKEGIL